MQLLIPPPIIAALAGGLIWLIDRLFPHYSFDVPGGHFIAMALIVLGATIDFAATRKFIKEKTTYSPFSPQKSTSLVKNGLYQYSRNPMYLGLLIILVGVFFYISNILGALVIYGFIEAITRLQIISEEKILEEIFGDEYRAYKRRVRRWL